MLRRVSGAEPQVVGLAPQTTEMNERANTMKTYLLRDQNTVEPQKPFGAARLSEFQFFGTPDLSGSTVEGGRRSGSD